MMAKIPEISRLAPNVIRILGCNPGPMTLQGTNTYLLGDGVSRMLIDTGEPDVSQYTENLKSVLEKENAFIETIILTHWHHDHVGGVKNILSFSNTSQVWKFPCNVDPEKPGGIPQDINVKQLQNGQQFSVKGATVQIIHTPGHTTDHVALAMNDGILFSGDCILGEGTAVFEDLHDYMSSLNKILDIRPTVIYPGHGNVITDPMERIRYYISHRNKRESQILEVLKTNPDQTFTEMNIVKLVYKDTPKALLAAAAYNVNHHLVKLVKEGKILKIEKNEEIKWRYANKCEKK